MDRSTFLRMMGAGISLAVLGLAGCSSNEMGAVAAKQACFANQVRIKQMENLFQGDTGEYAPIGDVVSKMGVKCPSGGTYAVDSASDIVSCSVHGSAPPS